MENDDNQTSSAVNEESVTPEDATKENATEEATTQEQASSCAGRLSDELKEARQCCDNMRRKAVERLQNARSTTLGDVLDGATDFAKRHPQCSLGIAATLGFFMGRLFRR